MARSVTRAPRAMAGPNANGRLPRCTTSRTVPTTVPTSPAVKAAVMTPDSGPATGWSGSHPTQPTTAPMRTARRTSPKPIIRGDSSQASPKKPP